MRTPFAEIASQGHASRLICRVCDQPAREGRLSENGVTDSLDEGIDVPACGTAYILASSRDPRQFIQRRGRILRRSPGKESATIHDYIVVLPAGSEDEQGHARKLISSELKRVAEFAGLAQNRPDAYRILRPILQSYDLEHVL